MLIAKAGKAIAMANTRAAELQSLNTQLQYRVNTIAVTNQRKRIPTNQNERFKSIEAIKLAVEAAAIHTKELVFSVSPPKHRDAGFHPKPVE
jgi:hypothetical protein